MESNASLELPQGTLHYQTSGDGPPVIFTHALNPLAWGSLAALTHRCQVVLPLWNESSLTSRDPAVWSLVEETIRDACDGETLEPVPNSAE